MMKKNTLLTVVLALLISTGFGQTYEVEWTGPDLYGLADAYDNVAIADFDNDGNVNIILYDGDNGTILVYGENYTEVWSNNDISPAANVRYFYNLTGDSTKEFVYDIWDENAGELTVYIVNTVTNVSSNITLVGAEFIYGTDFDSDGLDELAFNIFNSSNDTYHQEIWGYSGIAQTFSNHYPDDFQIKQNYPNPFNPSTSIEYKLNRSGSVMIGVFNIKGQLVETLDDSYKTPGNYSLQWQPKGLSSGQYYYQIILDGEPIKSKKAIYLK
jgi:hypothetical protein